MPLTTYTAGDVLTAASLNANFTFAAANPPASTSGLTFLTGTSVSAVSSFSLPNNTFTATHQNYRILIEGAGSANDNNVSIRFRSSGTDNTASSYQYGGTFSSDASVTRTAGGTGQTSFDLFGTSTTKNVYCLDIIAPQVSVNSSIQGTATLRLALGQCFGVYAGNFANTTVFDALSVIFSAGTFTGTYRVYGYSES